MNFKTKSVKQLIAEFFANIGVGWFAGGVIGAFSVGFKDIIQSLISIAWGIIFSVVFLFIGIIIINRKV